MEFLIKPEKERPRLKAALFDFDGTLSTLRHGWEGIMEPMMLEMITGGTPADEELMREVREYIDQSTGIQTYYQMQWLVEAVQRHGRSPEASRDPWWYKAEYNRRLMEPVSERKKLITTGEKIPSNFLIKNSQELLEALKEKDIALFVASGTDHADVVEEAEVLGLRKYFKEIAGAPPGKADCSKEAVLRKLIHEHQLHGAEVVVIGDGKVEIALGRETGTMTLGVASDEDKRSGINPVKRTRLMKAGAHAIVGDFTELDQILNWLGLL